MESNLVNIQSIRDDPGRIEFMTVQELKTTLRYGLTYRNTQFPILVFFSININIVFMNNTFDISMYLKELCASCLDLFELLL